MINHKAEDLNTLLNLGGNDYIPWYQMNNYSAYHTNGIGLINYTDAEALCKTLPNIHIFLHDSGMISTHNMPCPVCKINHAVLDLSIGVFDVCIKCKSKGWYIGKRKMSNEKPKRWWEFWK